MHTTTGRIVGGTSKEHPERKAASAWHAATPTRLGDHTAMSGGKGEVDGQHRFVIVMYAKPDRCQTSSNWGETTTNAGGKTAKADGKAKAKAKSQSTAELFDAVHQRLGLTTGKDPLLRPFALGAATRTPSRRSMRSGAAPEL